MSVYRRSTILPFQAPLTEKNLPDQTGKVFIVTGGNSGVGKELVQILYQHHARVWIAARSEERVTEAINDIKKLHPNSRGQLRFLSLNLGDLSTIKESANQFLAQEERLDVLWNNAGIMLPPEGSTTTQGYEAQLGVNVLGHFFFVKMLTPLLLETALTAKRNSVRIVWVSSVTCDMAPQPWIDLNNMDFHIPESNMSKYGRSKAGNLAHAAEFQRRYPDSGIVSLSLHPGLLRTNLQKNFPPAMALQSKLLGRPAKFGAYTELYAGLDSSITEKDKWITPWGHREEPRSDIVAPELAGKYWEWCEQQIKPFL